MCGIDENEDLRRLEELLGRDTPVNALGYVARNLGGAQSAGGSLRHAAVCLDTCVLFHLMKHTKFETIIDYFSAQHKGLLVVSAQTVQEFWNNHLFSIETVAAGIQKKFEELGREVQKIDRSWDSFLPEIQSLVGRLKEEFGHLHDHKLRTQLARSAELLFEQAKISEVPRSRFHSYGVQRKLLKTPPGFEDTGHGDFFVWLDFLFSIKRHRVSLCADSIAVIVTDDKKKDWSKGAVPHPVLSAEMSAYTGIQFETWSLEKLARKVEEEIAGLAADAGHTGQPADHTGHPTNSQ